MASPPGLTLTLGGPLITRYLIGNQYAEVNTLWFGLGVLAFCRFLSSSILVSLVALNRSKTNLIGEAATTLVSVPLMILLLPRYGLVAVPWIMSAGALATATVLLLGRIHIQGKPSLVDGAPDAEHRAPCQSRGASVACQTGAKRRPADSASASL